MCGFLPLSHTNNAHKKHTDTNKKQEDIIRAKRERGRGYDKLFEIWCVCRLCVGVRVLFFFGRKISIKKKYYRAEETSNNCNLKNNNNNGSVPQKLLRAKRILAATLNVFVVVVVVNQDGKFLCVCKQAFPNKQKRKKTSFLRLWYNRESF